MPPYFSTALLKIFPELIRSYHIIYSEKLDAVLWRSYIMKFEGKINFRNFKEQGQTVTIGKENARANPHGHYGPE